MQTSVGRGGRGGTKRSALLRSVAQARLQHWKPLTQAVSDRKLLLLGVHICSGKASVNMTPDSVWKDT